MAHPNEELVREAFAAFGRGDTTADALHFAEDIRWHVSGRAPFAGDFKGMDQVLGSIFGPIFELSEGTYSFELHDVLASDEQAVALYTSRADRAGKHWEGNLINVIHIRDGKVTEIWTYSYDPYTQDEFWS
jgi:uncharacterized protein